VLVLILDNVLSDISDDGRTASMVQHETSHEYQRFLPPISEQGYANT